MRAYGAVRRVGQTAVRRLLSFGRQLLVEEVDGAEAALGVVVERPAAVAQLEPVGERALPVLAREQRQRVVEAVAAADVGPPEAAGVVVGGEPADVHRQVSDVHVAALGVVVPVVAPGGHDVVAELPEHRVRMPLWWKQ